MFCGSYRSGEVEFLLTPLDIEPIADIALKERLIQSGARHYSEMLGVERQPTAAYLALFDAAVEANAGRMARDVLRLAQLIAEARPQGPTLVSLARAGTPVGVLLRHALTDHFGIDAPHYSVSIIRDRGIDGVALDHICAQHAPESIAFVDGWTGKGAIARELTRALAVGRAREARNVPDGLYVLCDLAGLALAAGSSDDYLIPSAILNATVSGLVSRSVLNEQVGPDDFHGCRYHQELAPFDRSTAFIDRIRSAVDALVARVGVSGAPASDAQIVPAHDRAALQQRSEALLSALAARFDVRDRNFIKPGIGEATRLLLRRTPRVLLLADADDPQVRHLQLLAQERDVEVIVDADLPLRAVSIIRTLADA